MSSARYRDLTRRLARLRKHFLPRVFSATGDYTEMQLDHARGYRLLVHAEIEAYLEDRARAIMNMAVKNWTADRKPREIIVNLLSFQFESKAASNQDLKNEYAGRNRRKNEAVQSAQGAFNRILSLNHGIKEENILKILLPLSLKGSDIDPTWLGTIDSFGAARGETAHSSIKVQQPLDPKGEAITVDSILRGLKEIDQFLNSIKI
jgi:hypothetical protein